jgi:hypothetical protein
MKKISTMQVFGNEIFKEQKLTIGLDLGDRWSFYCVLDEVGKIILEQKVATTPEAIKQTFGKIPQSLRPPRFRHPPMPSTPMADCWCRCYYAILGLILPACSIRRLDG